METKFKVGDRVRHVLGHEGIIESAQTDSIKVKVTYYKPRTSGIPPKTRTQRTAFGRKIKSPNFYDDLYINYKIKEDKYLLPSWRVVESETEMANRLIKEMQSTPLTFVPNEPTPDRAMIAAMAMQGIISSGIRVAYLENEVAIAAVSYADALIAELQKPKQ